MTKMNNNSPVIIAEVGCNHKGNFDTAVEMIKIASSFCNVDIIKFQKRNIQKLYTQDEYDKPHPNPENSYGESYGKHREFLEFDIEQHLHLKKECEKYNKKYSSSVWDIISAEDLVNINPSLIKVPSAINNNYEVLDFLFKNYKGEIHISLGMTTRDEEKKIIDLAIKRNMNKNLILYHCISDYPVDISNLYLNEIIRLQEDYKNIIKAIGFSGHHKGISADIAALAYGAKYFERHFTLDRTWKGTDHAASLEPDGMRKLSRDLNSVCKALRYKTTEIDETEKVQRAKLKYKNEKN